MIQKLKNKDFCKTRRHCVYWSSIEQLSFRTQLRGELGLRETGVNLYLTLWHAIVGRNERAIETGNGPLLAIAELVCCAAMRVTKGQAELQQFMRFFAWTVSENFVSLGWSQRATNNVRFTSCIMGDIQCSRLTSSIPFKHDLALQSIPLSIQPFKTQPQVINEDIT